jgi:hypothetical protein
MPCMFFVLKGLLLKQLISFELLFVRSWYHIVLPHEFSGFRGLLVPLTSKPHQTKQDFLKLLY